MRAQRYVILAILFVIIVAVFAVTNVETVEVNYLVWSSEVPLIMVILFSVLMGGIITAAAGAVKIYKLKRENKELVVQNRLIKQILAEYDLLDKAGLAGNEQNVKHDAKK